MTAHSWSRGRAASTRLVPREGAQVGRAGGAGDPDGSERDAGLLAGRGDRQRRLRARRDAVFADGLGRNLRPTRSQSSEATACSLVPRAPGIRCWTTMAPTTPSRRSETTSCSQSRGTVTRSPFGCRREPRPALGRRAYRRPQPSQPITWAIHLGESFPDVPPATPSTAVVETLFHNGVTTGCAVGGYCPGGPVTRAQMAVFLLESKFGSAHIPPPCAGSVFTDVPASDRSTPGSRSLRRSSSSAAAAHRYCPGAAVTRQQLAVFLLKAFEGSSYDPARLRGHLRRRHLHARHRILGLDRRSLQPRNLRRLLHGAARVLPDQPQQPRADGRVSGQDVRSRALRRLKGRSNP